MRARGLRIPWTVSEHIVHLARDPPPLRRSGLHLGALGPARTSVRFDALDVAVLDLSQEMHA